MKLEQIQLVVSGRVQGVGFRAAAFRTASSLGLTGWVRNTPDERVEITAVGEPEKIDEFLLWCGSAKDGPRGRIRYCRAFAGGLDTAPRI